MAPKEGGELTPTEYIQHHLHNLTARFGQGDFMTLHVDTFVTAVLMGLLIVFMFWIAVRKPTAGVPGKWQAFVEICLEFVDRQARDTYHGTSKLVTPIAITLFFWILLIDCVVLGWVGANKPEGMFPLIGLVGTLYYFFHFLILLPILGKIERPLPLPTSISESVTKRSGAPAGAAATGGKA